MFVDKTCVKYTFVSFAPATDLIRIGPRYRKDLRLYPLLRVREFVGVGSVTVATLLWMRMNKECNYV